MAEKGEQRRVVRSDRLERLRLAGRKLRVLLEAGSLTWSQSVIKQMRVSRGFDAQDQSHLIETGSVTKYGTKETDGGTVRWYRVMGLTVEGCPAKLTVEVQGLRGVVTEAQWLP